MIKKVAKAGVYVSDQQRALDFYTDVLGFRLVTDQPMGEESRWIEVAPDGDDTTLALWTPPGLEDRIGSFSGVVLSCDDIHATYAELRERGVEFTREPTDQPGGVMGTFKDVDGNEFVLREAA
jgi:predicted enzyme related to lactoylglutathione lyase